MEHFLILYHTHINIWRLFIYKINYPWLVSVQKTKLRTMDEVREMDFGSV